MCARTLRNGFTVCAASGESIAHEALSRMPVAHSIEPWVRTHFPLAEFVAVDAAELAPLDLQRPGVLALQGPKGLGKSKAIRAAVARLPPRTTVVQVTFRRSLAWSSAEMLGCGASVYSDVGSVGISARQHPRLTIVVNSVARIRGAYDVVVIDEIVSVLDMLSSELLSPPMRTAAVDTLRKLVAAAQTVVIADAMLDPTCIDFVLLCRGGGNAVASGATTRVLDYTRRIHTNYCYYAHALFKTWQAALDAALAARQRVVVPCMTKAMALQLEARYRDRYALLAYTGDSDNIAEHMSAIHDHWSAVQLLIYSPVITAGCSFELKHFDVAFFYGCPGLGSPRSAVQMIARVRDFSSKAVHVFLARAESFAPLARAGTVLFAASTPDRDEERHLALLRLLDAYRTLEAVQTKQAFPYYFWALVAHSGARISCLRPQDAAEATRGDYDDGDGDGDGDTSASDGADAPAEAVAYESPFFHDWGAAFMREQSSGRDAPQGTLLQRVTFAAALLHLGGAVAPPRPQRDTHFDGSTCVSGSDRMRRAAIWLALLVQKGLHLHAGAAETWARPNVPFPWQQPALWSDAPRIVRCVPAVAAVRSFATPQLARLAEACLARYTDSRTDVLQCVQDAWVLAGVQEHAQSARTPVSSRILEPMPVPPIAATLQRIDNVRDALRRLHYVRTCILNHAVGSGAHGVAIVDVVVVTADKHVHLVCLRQSTPRRSATWAVDVLKLQTLAAEMAVAPPFVFAGTHVVYADAAVHCDALAAPAVALPAVLKRCAQPLEHVLQRLCCFVVVQELADGIGVVVLRGLEHASATFDSGADAWAFIALAAARATSVVSWGLHLLAACGGASAALAPAFDLERTVAALLDTDAVVPLAAAHCHRVACSATSSPAQTLRCIVAGVLTFGVMVVFWDGKPHGLHVWTISPFWASAASPVPDNVAL